MECAELLGVIGQSPAANGQPVAGQPALTTPAVRHPPGNGTSRSLQDWMHLIRSQAFANLWMKAWKAHESGLHVVRAMGTDELHVIGGWHQVFPEGRGVTEVKVKDTYTVGTTADSTMGEGK